MNVILLTQRALSRLCDRLLRHGFLASKPTAPTHTANQIDCSITTKKIAFNATISGEEPYFSTKPIAKPLRVVRVWEAGKTRSSVDRMVISGRMADVCAELDRLVACEAAMT